MLFLLLIEENVVLTHLFLDRDFWVLRIKSSLVERRRDIRLKVDLRA